MLTSISPLGERARGNRFWRTAVAYAVGSLLGGVAVGAALGALGDTVGLDRLDEQTAAVAVLVAAAVGVVLDTAGRLPTLRRQVDERWLSTYRGWVYGFGFGIQLGTAVSTIVTASVTYVFLLATLLTASPPAGMLVGAVFGAARALPLLATARVRSPEDLARLHRGVASAAAPFALGTRAAQVGAAFGALVLLGTTA